MLKNFYNSYNNSHSFLGKSLENWQPDQKMLKLFKENKHIEKRMTIEDSNEELDQRLNYFNDYITEENFTAIV